MVILKYSVLFLNVPLRWPYKHVLFSMSAYGIKRVSCFSSMQAKSYEFPPYFLTISTAVCLSFYDTHHQNCGIKTNLFNAVGFELKFLKKFPSIKNTLMFSVQYENLIRVNWCKITTVKEFLHISGVVWFTIEILVITRSHWFNNVAFFPNVSLDGIWSDSLLCLMFVFSRWCHIDFELLCILTSWISRHMILHAWVSGFWKISPCADVLSVMTGVFCCGCPISSKDIRRSMAALQL